MERLPQPKTIVTQDKPVGRFANKVIGANAVAFGISLVNDRISSSPVSFSQTIMEGIDLLLPGPLKVAEKHDNNGNYGAAIGWRSVTNTMHMFAATVGAVGAERFIAQGYDVKPSNVILSGFVGLWNLGIYQKIQEHKKEHHAVEMTVDNIAEPMSPEDVLLEVHHTHKAVGRNLNNMEVCVKSNIVEAMPVVIAPVIQSFWENGAAVTVIGVNAVIFGMNAKQFGKDISLAYKLRDTALPTKLESAPDTNVYL